MKEPNLRSRVTTWLGLALAVSIVANIVWSLVVPLIVPGAVMLVVGAVLVLLFRRWRHRNFW